LNQKDLKRYRKMLEDSKLGLLQIATKTLREEANFDSDDLPDEIDLASSEYAQSMIFRLRDREKFLFKRIERALTRIEEGTFGICERCHETISPKRLDAYPVSTMCIWCKEEQEDGLIAKHSQDPLEFKSRARVWRRLAVSESTCCWTSVRRRCEGVALGWMPRSTPIRASSNS